MVSFFTSYLGGTHGTAKSARDFLRALLAFHDSVNVIAPNQEMFPDKVCGKKLGIPEWFDMPKGILPPRNLRDVNLTRIREWIKDRKVFHRLYSRGTVIVNGWASYDQWQLVKNYFSGQKIVIVRESPRHFTGPDRNQSLPDLLGGFSSFDGLIFVSERSCLEWRQYGAIAAKPYAVLPNCCEEEDVIRYAVRDRDFVRKQLGFSPDDFVLLCPGSIEHRKGQDLLMDIVPELRNQIPNLKILLVGDPATQWGVDLLKVISGGLLAQTVEHWLARPDIMDLLYAADTLVFPSRAEALPRTILEAMVMKTPVVASDVDGIPELIQNSESGLLFLRDDKEGFLRAILHCYANPDLRKKMTENASEKYWKYFSRSKQFSRMADVVEMLHRANL